MLCFALVDPTFHSGLSESEVAKGTFPPLEFLQAGLVCVSLRSVFRHATVLCVLCSDTLYVGCVPRVDARRCSTLASLGVCLAGGLGELQFLRILVATSVPLPFCGVIESNLI